MGKEIIVGEELADSAAYRRLEASIQEPESEEMRAWKDAGGKVIGCLYNNIPEELIVAAGLTPYRIRAVGSTGAELADSRFSQINCSLVRHLYDSAKRGRFDFIDGLVAANDCDHMRKLYENWKATIDEPYFYFLGFPKKHGEPQAARLATMLGDFKKSLEGSFGVEVTDEKLRAAIDLLNEIRQLQRELRDMCTSDDPPISGAQMLTVAIAGDSMPKKVYRDLLRQLVIDVRCMGDATRPRARLVIYGGEIDSPELLVAIESQGALVVADSLGGFGSRNCACDVSTTGDLLFDLAHWLVVDRPHEPRTFNTAPERYAYVDGICKEYGADGVVQVHVSMCDLWSYDRLNFDRHAGMRNIPCLDLDIEYVLSGEGQLKTRVQAFVETITDKER